MPTQPEKLAAHAEHLLDGFLSLRERWAMLSPMLSDRAVKGTYAHGHRSRGFAAIRTSLVFSCTVDIANLCTDKHIDTPSLRKIHGTLLDPNLCASLRRIYCQSADPTRHLGEPDEQLRRSLKAYAKHERDTKSAEFDQRLHQFRLGWSALEAMPTLRLFCDARDKVAAHSELHYVDGQYTPVSLASLGLKPSHFPEVIEAMQPLVEVAQNITRSAGFAWPQLDAQLAKSAKAFWTAK
jgi:hypothetical protein